MDKIVPIVAVMVSSIFADTLYLKNGEEINLGESYDNRI